MWLCFIEIAAHDTLASLFLICCHTLSLRLGSLTLPDYVCFDFSMFLTFTAGPLHNGSNTRRLQQIFTSFSQNCFSLPLKANSFSANNTHKNYNQILSSVSRVNPQFLFRMLFLSLSYILNCYVYRVRCTLEQCKRRKIASDRIQICHWLVRTKFNRWRQSPNQAN